MTTNYRRIALLTGVSAAAMGVAAPAAAATITVSDILHLGLSGAPDVSDTLTICLLDDTCVVGTATATGVTVLPLTAGFATPRVQQAATATGDVTLSIANPGAANVGALVDLTGATITGAINSVTAGAIIQQQASAAGTIGISLANAGTLVVGEEVTAVADTGAVQLAMNIGGGVLQTANGGTAATLTIANTDVLAADAGLN
jgi:hypothetical protein